MTEQEAFEKWASVDGSVMRNIEKRGNGMYWNVNIQSAWSAWQACAARKDVELNPLKLAGKVALDRIAELKAKESQLRALLDTYNLGGWTDAERLISERDALAAQNEVLRNALKVLHDLECEDLRSPDDEDVSYELRYAKEALAMTDTGAEILRRRDAALLRKLADEQTV